MLIKKLSKSRLTRGTRPFSSGNMSASAGCLSAPQTRASPFSCNVGSAHAAAGIRNRLPGQRQMLRSNRCLALAAQASRSDQPATSSPGKCRIRSARAPATRWLARYSSLVVCIPAGTRTTNPRRDERTRTPAYLPGDRLPHIHSATACVASDGSVSHEHASQRQVPTSFQPARAMTFPGYPFVPPTTLMPLIHATSTPLSEQRAPGPRTG
jgi:hypothetical protein